MDVDAAPSYVATPLSTLGGPGSSASGIKASGQVAGSAEPPPVPECVYRLYNDGQGGNARTAIS